MKSLILTVILTVALVGFVVYTIEPQNEETQIKEKIEYNASITIGTIHRDSEKMIKRYQPLANHIAEKLSDHNTRYQGIVNIPPTEETMIELVKNGNMDVFFDSPLIGMKVTSQTELEPALLSWKEGHKEYHSVFIVPKDSEITFDNLYNKTVVFEDNASTSGYLLPLIHLQKSGYILDQESSEDLSFVFSLDDENTPIWVIEGKGDIGATSNLDFEDIPQRIKDEVRVLESTESIPRQIIFLNDSGELQNKVKKILLEMNENIETREILKKISKTSHISEIDNEVDLKNVNEIMELIQ